MAENQSTGLPAYFSKLSSNLFSSERSLIKLRDALPVETQEPLTKQIQSLAKERIAFISDVKSQSPFNHEANSLALADLQERYNECLGEMIAEIVEAPEQIEYKETENVANVIRRVKTSTKGMIVGNFNEVLQTMDRIIGVGENLIVQGYQKLFIDSPSVKDKLQNVIDERQSLPVCSRPLDTLIAKQNFCEKQLRCLLMLLEEANTLTDLIGKLQEFNKKQIQFQQASQVTIDAMKKFFYPPDVRKTNERRRTYLSVSYADPSNSREGLDILRDQLNSVIRTLNNLCDMEDLKVRTVKKSDLGDECEREYENTLKYFAEEKELIKQTLSTLVNIEDNQVDLEKSDHFIEDLVLPEEVPQSQLEYIKFYARLGLTTPYQRLYQARLFNDLVQRFDQDHTTYSSSVERLEIEVQELIRENQQLKSKAQGAVVHQIGEGRRSLQDLMELQDHLKLSIKDSLESQLRKQIHDSLMVSSGISDLLLDMNPDEDLRLRVAEFDAEYKNAKELSDLVRLVDKYQGWNFRLTCRLGKVNEALVHSNLAAMKRARSVKEARESIAGKPNEYPLAAMERVLSESIKLYLAGIDERKNNLDSVSQKQLALSKLLKDYRT